VQRSIHAKLTKISGSAVAKMLQLTVAALVALPL
jgi:hypothetical protein